MQQSTTPKRLLKFPEVRSRTQVSKTAWYRKIKDGTAPAPVRLSVRSVAWLESDIDAYIATLSKGAK